MNSNPQESPKALGMRLIASSLLTVGLSMSFFLTLLAPIPLLLLYYFRGLKTFLVGQLISFGFFLLAALLFHIPWQVFILAQGLILFLSSLVIYCLQANRPVELWRRFHGMLLCLFAGILFLGQLIRLSPGIHVPLLQWVDTNVISSGKLQEKFVELKTQMPSKEVDYLIEIVNSKEKLHRLFWLEIPQGLIFLLFLAAWINLLIGMRAARFQKLLIANLKLNEKADANIDVLKDPAVVYFRNPDVVLYLIIIALGPLAWHFWQGELSKVAPEVLSWSYWSLNLIAISYFFQGFPLLGLSMQYLGARRGLSSFLIAITIIFSSWLVSLMGFLDHWIDLRSMIVKHLNKKGPTQPTK